MKIHLLGTGTPTPSLHRMCSGYVVEVGKDILVFDHGFGAHHRLLELGIDATRVTHFFCSHLHYDHMGDYPRLLLTRWDQGAGRIPDLKVYGPPPIAEVNRALFDKGGAFWPDLVARTEHMCSVSIYHARGGVGERAKPKPEVTEMRPNEVVQGGSTLTQQLAKNLFLSSSRSWLRKGQEAVITLMIETTWDKRRILEVYLNVAEWGNGLFGAEAAARRYYGRPAASLGPGEAARLAVMLPNPRYYERNYGPRLAAHAARVQRRMIHSQVP